MRHHRDGLDALGPGATYRLAGFSFGGVIALEIARQLGAEADQPHRIKYKPLAR